MPIIDYGRRGVLALVAALPWGRSSAQAWPARELRIVVPAGPGSVPDVRARWLAERLGPGLGQPVLVENRPGAGGTLAMQAVARSAPDGYSLVMTHLGLTVLTPILFEKPGFDWDRDFAPITRVGIGPMLLVVSPASPALTAMNLADAARKQPGSSSFASHGIGTPPHLAAALFTLTAGFEGVHVPYANPAQPFADLVGGRVQWMMEGTPVALPWVASGRLRALAVTSERRLAALPQVPTMAECGWPSVRVDGWTALAAPAATPQPVIERLHREVARVLGSDEARQWFSSVGNEPGGETPQEFARVVLEERARWAEVARGAGIRQVR